MKKTTLNIREDLIREAQKVTGIKEKTALIHKGLEALIKNAAVERLIARKGTDPHALVPPRKRSLGS